MVGESTPGLVVRSMKATGRMAPDMAQGIYTGTDRVRSEGDWENGKLREWIGNGKLRRMFFLDDQLRLGTSKALDKAREVFAT